jgi:hypothetical protein
MRRMTWLQVVLFIIAGLCLLDAIVVAGIYGLIHRNEVRARPRRSRLR